MHLQPVKCDALRPFCSPCLKSARGDANVAQTKCKYEGTSVAAAREAAAAAAAAAGGNGNTGVGVKRRRAQKKAQEEAESGGSEAKRGKMDYAEAQNTPPPPLPPQPQQQQTQQQQDYPSWHQQHPPFPSSAPSFPLSAPSLSSAATTPPEHHQHQHPQQQPPPVVEELSSRVSQLERQLRLQADAHAAQLAHAGNAPAPPSGGSYYSNSLAHTRSPSFPYSASQIGGYSLPPLSSAVAPNAGPQPLTPGAYPPIQLAPPQPHPTYPSSAYPLPSPRGHHTGARTSLPSLASGGLSSLASAAGVGIDDAPSTSSFPAPYAPPGSSSGGGGGSSSFGAFSFGASSAGGGSGGMYSPSMVAESNLRGGVSAAPSPMSSLRHLVGDGLDTAPSSPRHSLWGITNGATSAAGAPFSASSRGYAVVGVPAPAPSTAPSATSAAPTPPSTTEPASSTTDASSAFSWHDPSQFALLPPSYPASLPPLSTLTHLVTAFFARAAVPSQMLDRASILRALQLGPAAAALEPGAQWPDEGLLHAICAYGSLFVAPESLCPPVGGSALGLEMGENEEEERRGRTPYWARDGSGSAKEYHYMKGKRACQRAMEAGRPGEAKQGRDLFQVLQAAVLLTHIAYTSAYFTDLWQLAGLCTRLCTPLGLSHLDAWDFNRGVCGPPGEDWGKRVRFVERRELLPQPQTLDEHWRRSVTFWMAFAVDRFASASTDWSTSIDEKDISTHLPCAATMPMPTLNIDRTTGQIPSLSISSPTFFEDTSAPIGSLGTYIKATILLGRVVNFLQRLPRARCADIGDTCTNVKAGIKKLPEFVELDVALSRFKASHSANFYDATGTQIDGFLASAYAIPHVATILLHEPFTERLDQSPTSSLARCLAAAKCVVNSMFILYQSSYDLGGCDPFLPFTWSVTGRALVRDYATRRRWASLPPSSSLASFADLDASPAASASSPGEAPPLPDGKPASLPDYQAEAEASKQLAEHCVSFMEGCAGKSGATRTLLESLRRHLADPDQLLPFDGSEPWAVSAYLEPL
ncbi:hypothetical protein JCM10213v2_001475 [Rhodosporidiobolus nylandii]